MLFLVSVVLFTSRTRIKTATAKMITIIKLTTPAKTVAVMSALLVVAVVSISFTVGVVVCSAVSVPERVEVVSVDLGTHSGSLRDPMTTLQVSLTVRNTLCIGNVTPLAVHSSMNAASSAAVVVSVPCSVPRYVTALLLKHSEKPSLLISLAENPHWHNPSTAEMILLTIMLRFVSAFSVCVQHK